MAETEKVTYVKLNRDGELIERIAQTPADHVQFRGTGWVRQDSRLGRSLASPKQSDASIAEGLTSTAVTAHAVAANAAEGKSGSAKSTSSTKS